MNEPMIVALAARRDRALDQPDLAEHLTAQNIWQAWTPLEDHLELPHAAEELIDAASAELGHFSPAGPQRRHAWECAQSAAWGLAHPLPRPLPPQRDSDGRTGAPGRDERRLTAGEKLRRESGGDFPPAGRRIQVIGDECPDAPASATAAPRSREAARTRRTYVVRTAVTPPGRRRDVARARHPLPTGATGSAAMAAPLLDAHQPLAVPCSEEQVRALFHWLDSLPNTERVSVCCERRPAMSVAGSTGGAGARGSNDFERKEKPMASTSTLTQANGHGGTRPPLRLLAEAVVALQHTLGCGDEHDNRALDQLERNVWLELRRVCTDHQEREHHIASARGLLASPGAPSCHHAARIMSLTAQALTHAIAGADADERRRIESLASRCAEAARRLQRIATEAPRPEMDMIERAPSIAEACFAIVAEHAAQTSAAIRHERSARLLTELESYGKALTDLAGELAHDRISDSEEGNQ